MVGGFLDQCNKYAGTLQTWLLDLPTLFVCLLAHAVVPSQRGTWVREREREREINLGLRAHRCFRSIRDKCPKYSIFGAHVNQKAREMNLEVRMCISYQSK